MLSRRTGTSTFAKTARRPTPAVQTINITNSTDVQIGDHNVQHIASGLMWLVEAIQDATASQEQKVAARGLLRELVANPVVASVLGGAATVLVSLLGK